VTDTENVANAKVQIVDVSSGSPAAQAGLMPGDVINGVALKSDPAVSENVDKVSQIQDFTNAHKGEEVVFDVTRGSQALALTAVPRTNPPAGEGAVGISLVRTAEKSYVWWQAVGQGFLTTWDLTVSVFTGWGQIIGRLMKNEGLPAGVTFVGPFGIGDLMVQAAAMGANYYLQFLAMISVYLAIFNALPIPALDGGKLLFLGIEAVRRKPVSEKVEQALTGFFFMLLIALSLYVTAKDIMRIF